MPRLARAVLCPRDLRVLQGAEAAAAAATIVIGITLHNQRRSLPRALASALAQSVVQAQQALVLILDDGSQDDWRRPCAELLAHPQVMVLEGRCGSAARARNALLDFVDERLPRSRWVARLDADDELAHPEAVGSLCEAAHAAGASYAIGSNHLEAASGERLPHDNIANPGVLQRPEALLAFIEAFCLGGASQELPSCNLVLRRGSGVRYPEVPSAEDHWLVAQLLFLRRHEGVIVPHPVYATYGLGGALTQDNRHSSHWSEQRRRLATACRVWMDAIRLGVDILGVGQEGIVWREGERVCKRFYPWALTPQQMLDLQALLPGAGGGLLPEDVAWAVDGDGSVRCHYAWFKSSPLGATVPRAAVVAFLRRLLRHALVTSNVKRANLRLRPGGELVHIDLGKDIVPFTVSRFQDAAARLYAIGCLGLSDHEMARRQTLEHPHEALARLVGFADFYRELVEGLFPHCRLDLVRPGPEAARPAAPVTLLVKACAQDAATLADQVRHIVTQLSFPVRFESVVLAIDPHPGPFLRQYCAGNLPAVLGIAEQLRREGTVDEVWLAPTDPSSVSAVHGRWFGNPGVVHTHTTSSAPLFPQIWAFEQVTTRHVLQCDADVLIGRQDFGHDFLGDMLRAAEGADVLGVGFNIAQPVEGFLPYTAGRGQHTPEIRLGLLDLQRVRAMLPLPNPVREGRFELMWHRAIARQLDQAGLRCLRGGDSRSFYVHPRNEDKLHLDLALVRDLVAQGRVPREQLGQWDLAAAVPWEHPGRDEPLVFLLKGRGTGRAKLARCLESLARQADQRFGLIVIDDGSLFEETWFLPQLLGSMWTRTTLLRRRERRGYIANFIEAVEHICRDPDTLVVTLDLDDALMSEQVSARLLQARDEGADLVHGVMFRPDKPLRLYEPDYEAPRRRGGGNVWAHLRGFRKSVFERIPRDYLRDGDGWIDDVTDYAVMVPAAELAAHPVFIDDLFCCWHQREPYPVQRKARQGELIELVLAHPALGRPGPAGPA